MALELGLKITRTRAPDNAASISELRISKSREGPVFVSTETHATFILTCYLKGYHRNSFEIKISEDGKEISINGEKPVQEILMMGRVMLKKNVETVGFRKVFKIPCGVVLDRISAKFDEDESLLKIVMPKLVKGICGVQIEEVRKEEGFGESSQKASEIGENESVFKLEEGLSDKKLVESTNGNVTADTIQKEIESPRFEAMKKSDLGENVCHTPKNIEDASPEVLKVPVLQPLEETENIMLGGPPGITGEDKFKGTPKGEVEEVKFENGSKDEERVQTEISKEGLEARDTTMQGRKSEKVLAGAFRTSEEDIFERTQIKETKLECESKDEERVGTKISEKGHAKRVGTEVSKGGLESIDAMMEEREPEKVFDRAFGINGEAIDEGKQKKEIEDTKSDSEGKFEERVEIREGGLEAKETIMEGDESRMMLVGATGFDEKGGIDETKQREFEEAKFETECKNEEREGRETGKEEPEAIETRMEGVGPEKVIGGKIEVSKEGVVKGITHKEIEDQDKERVKDIFGGTQKREIQKVESETGGANEERVGTETSKVGLEAMDTTMEGGESEMALVGSIRGSEAAKFEIEEKDEEFVGIENNEKGLEATESKMEGGESKKLLDGKIGVNEEDIVEGIEQREIDETKFEIEDRDKEKVEVFKGTLEKEIEKNEFAIEGKDEERVATEITEEFEAKGTAIEEGVLEKFLSSATRVTGKDIIEGTKKGEDYVPKFENENRDEEISNDEFEARKTKIEESPKQEPKLPVQLEESEGTFEGIESGEDKSEGAKQKEIEGPKFLDVEENSKIPKCATSQGSNLEGIEEAKQAMAKRGSEEAEGFLEKVEGEEPLKISEIASKVIGNDNARNSGKKEIEESANRSSGDGPQVRENIVRDMFEELGTDTAKFPGQITETKARREKEVKVKEDIIVKRERYVRVKEEMIVSKYDEAKEGFEKATTRDKIQLENGLPGDDRGFDEETLGAARWDKTKALKEGCVETEPSAEKVKGESNDNVQGEVFSPSMKDNTRERIEKETEDPMVGTKQKAQHHVQELPMKIAESLDEGEGPKETKTEEMKEAKRKSEETQVVADKESAVEEKIREAEIERIGKIKQFETALQEVPGAEDPKELGKGMREIESMLSTSEVKEIDKICEECKRSEASLEREKHRKTQNVKDDKATRENAVKQVLESMQKVPEKEHPRKSEVQKVKPLETKVAYPELRKKVETKNEVEEPRLKELPPLKVKMQSLEPLETEKTIMKWKSPKTKKIVPKAREEEEEYELGKPPEVKNSSTTRESMVDKQKPEIDIPKSITSRTPSEEKEIEASQPNVLPDHNLGEKEYFKTLTEDRGHYLLQKEKRLETNKVAEEEKLSQKDEDETSSCKRERKKIAEFKDKKPKIKRKGSEKINQMKGVAEEMKEAVADKETDKSQEILLPQTAEIQGKEKISEVRGVEQEKRRKIPFHADEELEAVISNREVESPKPTAAQPKQSSIEFSSDQTNDEVDELQRKELPSPSIKKLSKGPSKTSRSGVKEDAPTIENFPQLQEGKESTSSVEGTRASEDVANELDNPLAEKLVVAKEGRIDDCHDGGHLELEFQESTRRRPDQEVEKTHSSQQEEDHEGHAIEEEKAGEGENVVQLEISRESEDLEDIEVEASGKRVELRAPLVVAGSVFIVSLIIFFFGHKRSGKR